MHLLAALQQVQANGLGKGFLPTMDIQFAIETADLRLDCVGGDDQFGGHLRCGAARRKLAQDDVLALT